MCAYTTHTRTLTILCPPIKIIPPSMFQISSFLKHMMPLIVLSLSRVLYLSRIPNGSFPQAFKHIIMLS